MTRGRTVRTRCSAGAILITGSVMNSVTTLDASTTDLTARDWRASASECYLRTFTQVSEKGTSCTFVIIANSFKLK